MILKMLFQMFQDLEVLASVTAESKDVAHCKHVQQPVLNTENIKTDLFFSDELATGLFELPLGMFEPFP